MGSLPRRPGVQAKHPPLHNGQAAAGSQARTDVSTAVTGASKSLTGCESLPWRRLVPSGRKPCCVCPLHRCSVRAHSERGRSRGLLQDVGTPGQHSCEGRLVSERTRVRRARPHQDSTASPGLPCLHARRERTRTPSCRLQGRQQAPWRRACVMACVRYAAASQCEAAEPSTRPSRGASRVAAPERATEALHSLVKISSRTLALAQAMWQSAMAAASSLADSVAVSSATSGSTAPAHTAPASVGPASRSALSQRVQPLQALGQAQVPAGRGAAGHGERAPQLGTGQNACQARQRGASFTWLCRRTRVRQLLRGALPRAHSHGRCGERADHPGSPGLTERGGCVCQQLPEHGEEAGPADLLRPASPVSGAGGLHVRQPHKQPARAGTQEAVGSHGSTQDPAQACPGCAARSCAPRAGLRLSWCAPAAWSGTAAPAAGAGASRLLPPCSPAAGATKQTWRILELPGWPGPPGVGYMGDLGWPDMPCGASGR